MKKYVSLTALIVVFGYGNKLEAQLSRAATTPPIFKQLVVNGRPLNANLLERDGKHYVAIEDLAQTLGGSVGYSGENITLTIPQSSQQESGRLELGRIKGTLTYFFNQNYGNKPDVGSHIWLVTGHFDDIGDDTWFCSFSDYFTVGQAHHNAVKHAISDGNGNFELSDVPAGAYTLILQSNHSKGAALRDMNGKVELRKVQIRAGETFDASRDFGMTED